METQEIKMFDTQKAWNLYVSGELTFADAMQAAADIKCVDNVWSLGGTPERAHAAQLVLGDDIFEYMNSETTEGQVRYFAMQGAYARIRDALEAIYPEASGNSTDPWSAETYSDLYKDRYGFRPNLSVTGKVMRDYIRSCKKADLSID